MSDRVCAQCLLPNLIDCWEDDCPRKLVPAEQVRPDKKLCETMGRRIEGLETLVLNVADWCRGVSPVSELAHITALIKPEAERIRGKRKGPLDLKLTGM